MTGRGNPWNRGRGHKPAASKRKDTAPTSAEKKFREAQAHMQASIEKHVKHDDESSEEEEDLEGENILSSVLKSYSQLGGTSGDLGRTQQCLENAFQSGAAVCLICIAYIKRTDAIWSCVECYCFLHLLCVQRWAKNSIAHQKRALEENPQITNISFSKLAWACPKCRHDYEQDAIPQKYYCFCGQTQNPPHQPWLVPHSCGEPCRRPLQPLCGHECLLLCHPGPCPPCPKTVKCSCYCGRPPPRPQRCSNKEWSCGSPCSRTLPCGRHTCTQHCHPGSCPACPKTSIQTCHCGASKMTRPCATPEWHCDKVCGRAFDCGHHRCERVCHSGPCGPCPRSQSRTCPCGKATYILPCTEETSPCGDTCGRLLNCGQHTCSRRCHRGDCGSCLDVVTKFCRCGLHSKEMPCEKEYLCETRCKRNRDCMRHPCNRKCCDGRCPPCEKVCGRSLECRSHKCELLCHLGPCYPCAVTVKVTCRCGKTSIRIPCGMKKKTKPPRCQQLCRIGPSCYHKQREPHQCHTGPCPPCRQPCNLPHPNCDHPCKMPCHPPVKKQTPMGEVVQQFPCPECKVPVSVTCLGGHETSKWPCYIAHPSSCQRQCGRMLKCGNHTCSLPCHAVDDQQDLVTASNSCEKCEEGCSKPRPEECIHPCTRPCHPGDCAPCKQMLRLSCHCLLNQVYIRCSEWTGAGPDERRVLLSCSNQCPKNYPCGHRCRATCHPNDCPDAELCRKKVKVFCRCHRLKKEFACDVVRAGQAMVECDDVCKEIQDEKQKEKERLELQRKKEEEERNKEELEQFQKKFQPRKKHHDRTRHQAEEKTSFLSRYWLLLAGLSGASVAMFVLFQAILS